MQQEIGFVTASRGYLAQIDGLPSIKINDLVVSENGITGLVNALYNGYAEVLLLSENNIPAKTTFKKSDEGLSISVGDFLLGRAVNPLGTPIDGHGMLSKSKTVKKMPIIQKPKGMETRAFIKDQLISGITLIDSLLPIGRGQREFVIGDARSGKGRFLTNVIINQKGTNVICVYAAIGKPLGAINTIINILKINKAIEYSLIVASSSAESAPMIFLTPHTAFTIAEYFQSQGKDVLIILDDMGIHAKTYREIALLGGRSPGRESYPGDIFYQQAHLLERAGKFSPQAGGGSITALPSLEVNLEDFTGYIPTNIMSTTDGHLMFRTSLFNSNQKPAIDISLSVSRVGRQTQNVVTNLISRRARQIMARASQMETLSRFSGELPAETQLILRQKALIEEIINQEDLANVPLFVQTCMLSLVFTSFFSDKTQSFMRKNKQALIEAFTKNANLAKIANSVPNLKTDSELIDSLEKNTQAISEICKE